LTPEHVADLRVALSQPSLATRGCVRQYAAQSQVPVLTVLTADNPGKYPLMRELLYSPRLPPPAEGVMWFDDDSYLLDAPVSSWWERRLSQVETADAGVVGQRWYRPLVGGQKAAIVEQPWYTGRALDGEVASLKRPGQRFYAFATGGWWAARRDFLAQWDYPFPALRHNGGDTALGWLVHQQYRRLVDDPWGVAINQAARRGLNTRPLWEISEPVVPPSPIVWRPLDGD
jgi:hypothetical protein